MTAEISELEMQVTQSLNDVARLVEDFDRSTSTLDRLETSIKTELAEPVDKGWIYIKESLGQNGKPIDVYKLRTMKPQAAKDDVYVNEYDAHGNPIGDEARKTPLGKILRKFWVDEMPQFWNILKGDMKLVGIRPMRESDWQRYDPGLKERALKQKPGLVGINYAVRGDGGFEDNVQTMKEYLDGCENSSELWTDVKYFCKVWGNILFKGVRSN